MHTNNSNSSDSGTASSGHSTDKASTTKAEPEESNVHDRKVSWDDLMLPLRNAKLNSDKLTLGDVLASKPAEQQATSQIVRAVEKLPTGIAKEDEEMERLYEEIAAEEVSRSSHHDNVEQVLTADDDDDDDDGAKEDSLLVPPTDNQTSQSSQPSLSDRLKAKSKFKNLVNKHVMAKQNQSVENTLFGLTTALTHMESSEKDHFDQKKSELTSDRFTLAARNLKAGTPVDIEAQQPMETQNSDTSEDGMETSEGDHTTRGKGRKHKGFFRDHILGNIEDNWSTFGQFVGARKDKAKTFTRQAIMYVMLPSLAIAAILFYVVENPELCPVKKTEDEAMEAAMATPAPVEYEVIFDVNGTVIGNQTVPPVEEPKQLIVCPGLGASASWWFLFLGVRQIVTFTLALLTQMFVVDYLALASRFFLTWFGPIITVFVVKSKGWPFLVIFWAIYDLLLLSGEHDFAHHWGYWQDYVSLFNEENPSGNVVDNEMNAKILRIAIFVGVAVSIKRFLVVLFLGRQTFARYGEQLADVMKNMVLVGEVANLAKDIERYSGDYANNFASSQPKATGSPSSMEDLFDDDPDPQEGDGKAVNPADAATAFFDKRNSDIAGSDSPKSPRSPGGRSASAGDQDFTQSQQLQLAELLDEWEEPQTAEQKEEKKIPIGAVLQFRQALAFMKVRFPFLPAFGPADTRDRCIESAQAVYDRLLLRTPNQGILPFDTLALLAKNENGHIDREKAKLLIKAFRPDRDGKLSKLDFVKSVDAVYKSIRLLSANISNSSQIDAAVEGIINIAFYFLLGAVILALIGQNPLEVFLSFSGVVLAFAFMFGSSSSKYFEGIMFILLQAPYGVGDRIHFSRPETSTSIDGSAGWIIEKVTLYTTSVYWGATNERATIANGALSGMRVINAARSPNAQIFVNMKFALDTPYEKFEIFKAAIEQFLKDRPREWLCFGAFRPTEVAVEKGYVNYMTIAQHRNSWQDIGGVLTSKAELMTYELEVAKKLGMKYVSPPLPVDLTVLQSGQPGELTPQEVATMQS